MVFNQQSLPGATTGQALLPENDKPVDAFAAIKAQKQAEPVIDGMILECKYSRNKTENQGA